MINCMPLLVQDSSTCVTSTKVTLLHTTHQNQIDLSINLKTTVCGAVGQVERTAGEWDMAGQILTGILPCLGSTFMPVKA